MPINAVVTGIQFTVYEPGYVAVDEGTLGDGVEGGEPGEGVEGGFAPVGGWVGYGTLVFGLGVGVTRVRGWVAWKDDKGT